MSELAADWYSDPMLGNFFTLTCPYLYDLETVAYFALFRNYHSSRAIRPITETTQLFLELYRHGGTLYVHPLKVQLPLLAHDEPAARLGRRRIQARDVQRADLVHSRLGQLVGPEFRRPAGLLGADVSGGPGDPARR